MRSGSRLTQGQRQPGRRGEFHQHTARQVTHGSPRAGKSVRPAITAELRTQQPPGGVCGGMTAETSAALNPPAAPPARTASRGSPSPRAATPTPRRITARSTVSFVQMPTNHRREEGFRFILLRAPSWRQWSPAIERHGAFSFPIFGDVIGDGDNHNRPEKRWPPISLGRRPPQGTSGLGAGLGEESKRYEACDSRYNTAASFSIVG